LTHPRVCDLVIPGCGVAKPIRAVTGTRGLPGGAHQNLSIAICARIAQFFCAIRPQTPIMLCGIARAAGYGAAYFTVIVV
jgi:hypothetical protein